MSTPPLPNQTVRLMRESGGKPTQHGREFLDGLDRASRSQQSAIEALESGKADVATTLAGYGITDAEKLGIMRGRTIPTGDYTVLESDLGKMIHMNNGSPATLTFPAGLTALGYVSWMQGNAGVTLAHGGGGSIVSHNSALTAAGQWAQGTAWTDGTDWFVSGMLVP